MSARNPLAGNRKYEKVKDLSSGDTPQHCLAIFRTNFRMSYSYLPSSHEGSIGVITGAFGFVQLARNKVNGQLVAIKFLERGPDKVKHPWIPSKSLADSPAVVHYVSGSVCPPDVDNRCQDCTRL